MAPLVVRRAPPARTKMGRKKRRAELPWCFYCDREFDDEKILQQHQRAKHFKCTHDRCNKRLMTAPGMAIHMLTVHKIKVEKVPNAIEGRDNPEWLIEGMNGIPEGFEFALFDEDWDQFDIFLQNGIQRVPSLENAEVRQLLVGPESFTPDNAMMAAGGGDGSLRVRRAAPPLRGPLDQILIVI